MSNIYDEVGAFIANGRGISQAVEVKVTHGCIQCPCQLPDAWTVARIMTWTPGLTLKHLVGGEAARLLSAVLCEDCTQRLPTAHAAALCFPRRARRVHFGPRLGEKGFLRGPEAAMAPKMRRRSSWEPSGTGLGW